MPPLSPHHYNAASFLASVQLKWLRFREGGIIWWLWQWENRICLWMGSRCNSPTRAALSPAEDVTRQIPGDVSQWIQRIDPWTPRDSDTHSMLLRCHRLEFLNCSLSWFTTEAGRTRTARSQRHQGFIMTATTEKHDIFRHYWIYLTPIRLNLSTRPSFVFEKELKERREMFQPALWTNNVMMTLIGNWL